MTAEFELVIILNMTNSIVIHNLFIFFNYIISCVVDKLIVNWYFSNFKTLQSYVLCIVIHLVTSTIEIVKGRDII